MKCPIDQTDLVMTERQGVEIDYCPTCRGVWLDRGELDKIIDRTMPDPSYAEGATGEYAGREWDSPSVAGMSGKVRPLQSQDDDRERYGERYDDDDYDRSGGRKKKMGRRSFLQDIFDFD